MQHHFQCDNCEEPVITYCFERGPERYRRYYVDPVDPYTHEDLHSVSDKVVASNDEDERRKHESELENRILSVLLRPSILLCIKCVEQPGNRPPTKP